MDCVLQNRPITIVRAEKHHGLLRGSQSRAGLEPCYLQVVIGVICPNGVGSSIGMMYVYLHLFAHCQRAAFHCERITLFNLFIIGRIGKSQCQHALFLEICFVYTGKTLYQHDFYLYDRIYLCSTFLGVHDGKIKMEPAEGPRPRLRCHLLRRGNVLQPATLHCPAPLSNLSHSRSRP